MSAAHGGIQFNKNRLLVEPTLMNSYVASICADFIRQRLLALGVSFTFETVMSHESKLLLIDQARSLGFRVYLYYIATEDPIINVSRVENRVRLGGHDVPREKILSRYHRSLELLLPAIEKTNRAYIFDNSSGPEKTWIAEITDGSEVVIKSESIPVWVETYLLKATH